jgi:isoleucyl-tRNA synthetase
MKPLEGDFDANTDGEVLVVLDLRPDSTLLARRTARELVNRFQKLRKKVSLQPTDPAEFYYRVAPGAPEALVATFADIVLGEESYLVESLGGKVLEGAKRPRGGVVLGAEDTLVQLPGDENLGLVVEVATPAAYVAKTVIEGEIGKGMGEAVDAWVASKDVAALKGMANGGKVRVVIDGVKMELVVGKHLFWSATEVSR